MHPYATSSKERTTIPLYLAALAFALAWVVFLVASQMKLPFWIEVPGTAGIYGLLLELFRRHVWKWGPLHKWGVVKVPVLEGTWEGTVVTSFDQLNGKHEISVTIKQNWTDILLILRSAYSESKSLVGSILVSETGEVVLSYEYFNVPRAQATASLHAHRGTATLTLAEMSQTLHGEYYSGRDRQNYGSLELTRKRSKHERGR